MLQIPSTHIQRRSIIFAKGQVNSSSSLVPAASNASTDSVQSCLNLLFVLIRMRLCYLLFVAFTKPFLFLGRTV